MPECRKKETTDGHRFLALKLFSFQVHPALMESYLDRFPYSYNLVLPFLTFLVTLGKSLDQISLSPKENYRKYK